MNVSVYKDALLKKRSELEETAGLKPLSDSMEHNNGRQGDMADQAAGNKVDAAWRDAFTEFPDRFMVGTDTFTPERWHYIGPHAEYSRGWLADLPAPLAQNIAHRNAEALLRMAWQRKT